MEKTIAHHILNPSDLGDTLIISCNTIKKELEHAMKTTGISHPVVYLRSSLHDIPNVLNTRNCRLILPKTADCLHFFFPKGYKGQDVAGGVYYLTCRIYFLP